MPGRAYYGTDLAHIHDAGYTDFARAATPGLLALLRREGIRRGDVVELGCGSGAATSALVAAGHDVLAIDASAAMLRLARRRVATMHRRVGGRVATMPRPGRRRVPAVRFARARLPAVAIPRCDAVVAVGEVLNYMAGRAAFDRLFRRVARALRPGGLFVFDVREPGTGGATHGRVARSWAVLSVSTEDPARGTLTRRITSFRRLRSGYRRCHETHRLKLVAGRELAGRLRRLGFTVRLRRGYGRVPLAHGCTVVVARKRRPTRGS